MNDMILADGYYAFWEADCRRWRVALLSEGYVTAPWISGRLRLADVPGQWAGPFEASSDIIESGYRSPMGHIDDVEILMCDNVAVVTVGRTP